MCAGCQSIIAALALGHLVEFPMTVAPFSGARGPDQIRVIPLDADQETDT